MQKATVNHVDTYHVEQDFLSPPDEALYGMAEGQDGVWNWRGMPIDLVNENIVGAFPVMISSRGYGLVWDNESQTEFNPMSSDEEIAFGSFKPGGSVYRSKVPENMCSSSEGEMDPARLVSRWAIR